MKKFKKISSSFGTFLNTNSYIEVTSDNDFGYIDKSIECIHIIGECTNTIINSESKKTFVKLKLFPVQSIIKLYFVLSLILELFLNFILFIIGYL